MNVDVAPVFEKQEHLLALPVPDDDVQPRVIGRPVFYGRTILPSPCAVVLLSHASNHGRRLEIDVAPCS